MSDDYGMLIDGERAGSSEGATTTLVNPASGETFATVAEASAEDVDRAVRSAERAQQSWQKMQSGERARLLLALAELIRSNAGELAELETTNVGKAIRESRGDVELAADCFQYYAGAIDKVGGATIPASAPGTLLTFREPIGVCALIIPWNFPLAITSWKTAPALAMGNTVVIKPASQTPLTALHLGELALEAGIPPGVINVVTGSGELAGDALIRHELVRKIGFTGSTAVGTRVMKIAADGIKRVTLELGGKSAALLFADADLDRAIPGAMASALGNAGQDCCARSRLLVEDTVYDEVVARLSELFARAKVGDPQDEETEIGPLISAAHRDHVMRYVETGLEEGATLLTGGTPPQHADLTGGSYLQPAVFSEVDPSMRIAREEIFGPVLTVTRFRDEEEAIRIANDSIYGLSGAIFTRDVGRALRVARAIETGVISINSPWSVHLEAPFGGFRQSGLGRELGLAALDHYSEWKSVYIDHGSE
jgi:betaine-aldehyde dehydrogenase